MCARWTVADESPAEVNSPKIPVTTVTIATNPKSCGLSSRASTIMKPTRTAKLTAWPHSFAAPPRTARCFNSPAVVPIMPIAARRMRAWSHTRTQYRRYRRSGSTPKDCDDQSWSWPSNSPRSRRSSQRSWYHKVQKPCLDKAARTSGRSRGPCGSRCGCVNAACMAARPRGSLKPASPWTFCRIVWSDLNHKGFQ